MNVPLDRLYNFIGALVDIDLVIYRWYPHGSKKLMDLQPLEINDPYRNLNSIQTVCHDQEPLQFDLEKNELELAFEKHWNFIDPSPKPSNLKSIILPSNLRALTCFANRYDKVLLLHSEKNSKEISRFADNGFIPVYYWSHALISRDWFRYAEIDPKLKVDLNFKNCFLIYNRSWTGTREYRLKFTESLINNNLHMDSKISFRSIDNGNHYTNHVFKNPALKVNMTDIEKILPENISSSDSSADYMHADYQSCAIEVVLETMFDDERIHLTEKILRPIACGKPFLLMSSPGSLSYLRDYGFITFAPIIDEGYDSITDPVERMEKIISVMNHIRSLERDKKLDLYQKLHAIAKENQKIFFSGKFFNRVKSELLNNLNDGIEQIKHYDNRYHTKQLHQVLASCYHHQHMIWENPIIKLSKSLINP